MNELRFENADLFVRREGLKFLCKQLMREAWKCPAVDRRTLDRPGGIYAA